jgi:hypothetical protein
MEVGDVSGGQLWVTIVFLAATPKQLELRGRSHLNLYEQSPHKYSIYLLKPRRRC